MVTIGIMVIIRVISIVVLVVLALIGTVGPQVSALSCEDSVGEVRPVLILVNFGAPGHPPKFRGLGWAEEAQLVRQLDQHGPREVGTRTSARRRCNSVTENLSHRNRWDGRYGPRNWSLRPSSWAPWGMSSGVASSSNADGSGTMTENSSSSSAGTMVMTPESHHCSYL
ncbi:hypothetical protein GMORB2_5005 [Geosmithia morbida]|uniref:Uncharacterized protein n=1 Tax=Geosmithia morbida TaxID=1094350 RepID=A0A9P5D7A9_9HYPO|nr:uncharacterized protein GMORB2_5005 [Geosmithia morbida]KAF4124339.1 hypothetical protein GMORB2_5005 [Geosmithia morbida]